MTLEELLTKLSEHGKRVLYAAINDGEVKFDVNGSVYVSYGSVKSGGPYWGLVEEVMGEDIAVEQIFNQGDFDHRSFRERKKYF
ncbi:MAG: hypothetical protein ACWGQW_03135 [bacterium]